MSVKSDPAVVCRIASQRRVPAMTQAELTELEYALARDYLPDNPRETMLRLIATIRGLETKAVEVNREEVHRAIYGERDERTK